MWTAIVLAVVALPADNSARPHSLLAANAGTDGKSDGFSGECKDATCASAALHFMPYFAKEGKADASAIAAASTGCACTFGDGPVPDDKHQPKSVTTSSDAPLCMYSEDASEMLIKEEEVNLRVLDCHGVQGNLAAEKEKAITCLTPDYADALKPKRAAFLLGDSHGEDFELPLRMALRGQFQLLPYFALGVGLVPGHDANPARLTQSAEAHDWWELFQHVYATIGANLQAGDLVVIMEANRGIQSRDEASVSDGSSDLLSFIPNSVNETLEQLILIDVVEKANAKLLVVGDWDAGLAESEKDPQMTFGRNMKRKAMMAELKERHPTSLHYASMWGLFCETGTDEPLPDTTGTFTAHGFIPAGSEELASPPACSRNVPGTELNAMDKQQHANSPGRVYMWPFACDAVADAGLF